MTKFKCKIELAVAAGTSSVDLQVGADMRTAIEWLMLAGRRDEIKPLGSGSIKIENLGSEVVIKINKTKASEIAIAQRFS